MQEALALGDITAVEEDVSFLLADFEIHLDRKSRHLENGGRESGKYYRTHWQRRRTNPSRGYRHHFQMRLPVEASTTYRPLWQTKKRYVITMGGRGAGRSFETSQKIVANLVQTTRRFRAAIMRAVHADIRHSIWQELRDRVDTWGIESTLHIADSTMEMEHGRNSVHAHGFRKSSSDRTAKLKSLDEAERLWPAAQSHGLHPRQVRRVIGQESRTS
jgi:Phage terminase large subunit